MIRVTAKLTSPLYDQYYSKDRFEVTLSEKTTLQDLKKKLFDMTESSENQEDFFREFMFIVKGFLIYEDYQLQDGDEIIILPWLIGG